MIIKNLLEEHVLAAYETLKVHVPEFCGCSVCRGDVLVYALNRIPARYVSNLKGSVVTEVNLENDQSRATIDVTLLDAFRRVSLAPRCGRKPGTPA